MSTVTANIERSESVSCSVKSNSLQPRGIWPSRLLGPWTSPAKNTGMGCHFLLQCIKVKVKSVSHVQLLVTLWTAAYQASPSMGFSRQGYWTGLPLASPRSSTESGYFALEQAVSPLAPWTLGPGHFAGGCPVRCRLFSRIPGLYLLVAPPVMTIENVPKRCQMFP